MINNLKFNWYDSGIAVFRDGHTENIISFTKYSDDFIEFYTESGHYIYNNIFKRTMSGSLYKVPQFLQIKYYYENISIMGVANCEEQYEIAPIVEIKLVESTYDTSDTLLRYDMYDAKVFKEVSK